VVPKELVVIAWCSAYVALPPKPVPQLSGPTPSLLGL
jgi:hypothetical protein